MLADLPFVFRHDYITRGGVKRISRHLSATVSGDVPEVASSDAPVALRWKIPARLRSDVDRHMTVRNIGGAFYAAAFPVRVLDPASRTVADAAMLAERVHGNPVAAELKALKTLISGGKERRPSPDEMDVDFGDDSATARAAAEKLFASLVAIDGEVWREVPEPTLVANLDNSGLRGKRRLFLNTRASTYGSHPIGSPNEIGGVRTTKVFRIHLDTPWPHAFEDTNTELSVGASDVRIMLPDAFRFGEARNGYGRVVGRAIADFGPDCYLWSRRAVDLFLEIRTCYEAFVDDQEGYPIEDAAERLPELMSLIGRCHDMRERELMLDLETARLDEPPINLDAVSIS